MTQIGRRTLTTLAALVTFAAAGCTSSIGDEPEEVAYDTASETASSLALSEAEETAAAEEDDAGTSPELTVEAWAEVLQYESGTSAYGAVTNPGESDVTAMIGVIVRAPDGTTLTASEAVYVTVPAGDSVIFTLDVSVSPDDEVDEVLASVESVEPADIDGAFEITEVTVHTDGEAPMVSATLTSDLSDTIRGGSANAVCSDADGDVVAVGSSQLYQEVAPGERSYVEFPLVGVSPAAAGSGEPAPQLSCEVGVLY